MPALGGTCPESQTCQGTEVCQQDRRAERDEEETSTDLHRACSEDGKLDLQPVHLFTPGLLAIERTPVDGLVAVVPVERVEADDGQLVGDDLASVVGT